jgi:hypothetical protein
LRLYLLCRFLPITFTHCHQLWSRRRVRAKSKPDFGLPRGTVPTTAMLAHFQKRRENVSSTSYCEVLLKASRCNSQETSSPPDKRDTDYVRPHTARTSQERVQELQWELLEHSPYSPELTHNDFHLCGPLKNYLSGRRFADEEVV